MKSLIAEMGEKDELINPHHIYDASNIHLNVNKDHPAAMGSYDEGLLAKECRELRLSKSSTK